MPLPPNIRPRGASSFCTILFAVSFVALGCNAPVAAADSLLRIPAPVGFVDGAGLSEAIRTMGLAGQPASVKLLGLYYPTNVLAEILNQGYSAPSPFCKAILRKEYSSVSDSRKGFLTLVRNAKKESETTFDPNDPAIKRIFKHYENAARKIDPGVSVKASGMSILGTILDKDTVYAGCMLVNFAWSDGQTQVDMPFAMSFAFIRLGKQELEVSVMYPFRDAKSVTAANQKLIEWVGELEKRKPEE